MRGGGLAPHSFTQVGNAQLTTTSPKFGTACLSLDGNGDAVLATDGLTDVGFGTSPFTVRIWANVSDSDYAEALVFTNDTQVGVGYRRGWGFFLDSSSTYLVFCAYDSDCNYGVYLYASTGNVYDGNWHLFEVGRTGVASGDNPGDWFMFVDGTSVSITKDTGAWNFSIVTPINDEENGGIRVGGFYDDASYTPSGKLDSLQIFKGQCLHTESYTADSSEPVK